jgi:glucokinase
MGQVERKAMSRLVADIGGTNARFAVSHGWPLGTVEAAGADLLVDARHLPVRDFSGLAEAAAAYLDGHPFERPEIDEAVIAVATPVDAEVIRFTNSPWTFTRPALQAALGVERLAVINDFAAQAAAIPQLRPDDSIAIGGGEALPGWPIAVIGPGTGLGAAGLVPGHDGPIVVASEAGHVSFAPHDALELEVLRRLFGRFAHVSNERLISGPGLVTLTHAIAEISGRAFEGDTPEAVTRAAEMATSDLAIDALRVFSGLLGGAAGDLALSFGAKGGVFVCGGLCGKLGPFFDHVGFRARFEAKGRLGGFLSSIPCRLVTNPQTGLIGAAAYRLAP